MTIQLFITELQWVAVRLIDQMEIVKVLFSSSSARGDTRLKRAATRKMNRMMTNADRLHRPMPIEGFTVDSSSMRNSATNLSRDLTMRNYVRDADRTEKVGGFFWTWWRILNGSLYDSEGIWISTRIIIIQVGQLAVLVTGSMLMLYSVEHFGNQAEAARNDLNPGDPQWAYDIVPTKRTSDWANFGLIR